MGFFFFFFFMHMQYSIVVWIIETEVVDYINTVKRSHFAGFYRMA